MLDVDQRRKGRFGFVVPLAGGCFASGILRCGNDFKILILQFLVGFLPAWQIESAASPTGPGDHQNFLAAEIVEVHYAPLTIRHGEIGGDAGVVESSAKQRDFAEAVDAGVVMDHGLSGFAREAGEVEIFFVLQILRNGDAEILTACALRLDVEIVDGGQVDFADPQVAFGIGLDFAERGRAIAIQDCRGWFGRGMGERGAAREEEGSSVEHASSIQETAGKTGCPTSDLLFCAQ